MKKKTKVERKSPRPKKSAARALAVGAGSGLRRISPLAKSAAKQFCTYTKQEDSTEARLAEIIQDVIERTQRAMATGAKLADGMESESERCESGCKDPVAGYDSEGIPLCQACLDDLAREDDPNMEISHAEKKT